jgi:hypothetical protein
MFRVTMEFLFTCFGGLIYETEKPRNFLVPCIHALFGIGMA